MARMRNLIVLILLGICVLCPSEIRARKWNTNKDSIVVDAYSEDEDEGELQFDALEQPENTECMTLDHEPGMCVTLRRCHPILFGENGELRNPSLAQDYSQSVDACAAHNLLDDEPSAFESDLERSAIPIKSATGDKILCCAKDKIQYSPSRSSLESSNEELAMYPTTSIPAIPFSQDANPEQVTESQVVLELESGIPESSGFGMETAVEVVESTGRPEVPQQALNEDAVVPTDVPISSTMPSQPSEEPPSSPEPEQAEPEVSPPESQSEQIVIDHINPEEELIQQNNADDVCPKVTVYNTWPSFENYPFLAGIQVRANTGPLCSGSLIDSRHVLTAAHCLHRFNSKDVARMQVRLGFSKNPLNDTFNDFYLERKASKIIFHKRFHEQSKMDNNIALVQLDQPVEFDDHVAPISIFNGARGYDEGSCAGVEAGWIKYGNRKVTGASGGVIHYIEPPMSDFVLREAINKIYKNEDCQSQLYTEITDNMLCAKTDAFEAHGVSTDRFKGNDGGPLVIRVGNNVQQVGIKSWAYEGNQYPTVYTRVDNYLNWIKDNLKM